MIESCNEAGRGICQSSDWCNCDVFEGTIEVPMLQPMLVANYDRRFIAMHVIGVIAMTMRMRSFVVVFVTVMERVTRSFLAMDVRMITAGVAMMNCGHRINAASRPEPPRKDDRLRPTDRRGIAQSRSSEVRNR
jgi:hypothetical protein